MASAIIIVYSRVQGYWTRSRVLLNPIFWIVNPIQIHLKNMIENPNPNPLFKMDLQSNPNPITIQQHLEKIKRINN